MDLVQKKTNDGVRLVTSESVFKRHAQQLREDRVVVYGFGECKTLEAFSNACSRFIDLENIIETESTE